MKFHISLLNIIFMMLSLCLNCSKDCVTKSPSDPNLLLFSSFEKNCKPSLAGWSPDDTSSLIQFSQDVPPNGGHWSLIIKNGASGTIRVWQTVPAFQETTLYKLSFWAKANGVPGYAILSSRIKDKPFSTEPILLEADNNWRFYSATHKSKGGVDVEVIIGLSGSLTIESGTSYFDLVKLEKID